MINPNERESLRGLEIHIEAELAIVASGYPRGVPDTPITEWLFGPTADERYEVGLRGLLDAVKALEEAAFPNIDPGQP